MTLKSAMRFGLVGGLATCVHILVGGVLILSGTSASTANIIAFCLAFFVSFSGHYGYSFSSPDIPISRSLRRFLVVALTGLAVNQTLLLGLVHTTILPPTIALSVSTLVTAALTYVLSQHWAFLADT